jgi:flavorubredoxin
MTAMVVYESMYGCTKAIAEAIGAGLAASRDVRVAEVGALVAETGGTTVADDVDLLVVGGPTHAFSMSRAGTRADALKKAPDGSVISSTGVREWLAEVTLPAGTAVAAFDTKVLKPNLPGAASKAIEKELKRKGGRPVLKPHSFRVDGYTDLIDGETDAAREWGAQLAAGLGA